MHQFLMGTVDSRGILGFNRKHICRYLKKSLFTLVSSASFPSSCSKPDMSRLRLAAACALLKLAQEPCYHEIITLEQYQLCALVINVRTAPCKAHTRFRALHPFCYYGSDFILF